jgi:hypothetical protein
MNLRRTQKVMFPACKKGSTSDIKPCTKYTETSAISYFHADMAHNMNNPSFMK